jgi:ankyrin repeat protein
MADQPILPPVAPVDPLVMSQAMLLASGRGNTQAILRLVAGDESVNCRNKDGLTPLLLVLMVGHDLAVVLSFVKIGADLSIVDNNGSNVLHFASYGGNVDSSNGCLPTLPSTSIQPRLMAGLR